jgi:hypothetical protein
MKSVDNGPEALRNKIPTMVIDVKGDLPNLLLAFPSFDPAALEPWVEPAEDSASSEQRTAAAQEARRRAPSRPRRVVHR